MTRRARAARLPRRSGGVRAAGRRTRRAPSCRVLLALLAGSLALGSCAYFNALYNARQAFDQAETAAARGQEASARQSYQMALEKAARALRRSPDGRWADDALLLIGRSHLAVGDYAEARVALERALASTGDRDVRAAAATFLGAAELRLGNPAGALARLDFALSDSVRSGSWEPLGRLWRARARFETADTAGAWADLELALGDDGRVGLDAGLEQLARGIALDAPDAAEAAVRALTRRTDAVTLTDSVARLASAAAERWDPARGRALLSPVADAAWRGPEQDALLLTRARLAAQAGDTATAFAEAREVAERATPGASESARVAMARWRLAAAADLSDLEEVRSLLLPALGHPEARELVQTMKTVDVLLERGQRGRQLLAVFAAGELTRDRLGAPDLARSLFIAAADMAPENPYAGKALLAARAVREDRGSAADLRRREAVMGGNFYLRAAAGNVQETEFRLVEERLDRALVALVESAERDAERRDALVGQTIATLDSLRVAAVTDSMIRVCETRMDSLEIAAAVEDSAAAACVRADSARFDSIVRGLLIFVEDTVGTDTAAMDTLFPDTVATDTFVADTPLSASRRGPAPPPGHPIWALLRPAG